MIQLSEKRTGEGKNGNEIDKTLYLDRLDARNLVIKEGEKVIGYYGDVRTALKAAFDIAIKRDHSSRLTLAAIIDEMRRIDDQIDKMCDDYESMADRVKRAEMERGIRPDWHRIKERIDDYLTGTRYGAAGAKVIEITECRSLIDSDTSYRIVIDEASPDDTELHEQIYKLLEDEFFKDRKAPQIEIATEW